MPRWRGRAWPPRRAAPSRRPRPPARRGSRATERTGSVTTSTATAIHSARAGSMLQPRASAVPMAASRTAATNQAAMRSVISDQSRTLRSCALRQPPDMRGARRLARLLHAHARWARAVDGAGSDLRPGALEYGQALPGEQRLIGLGLALPPAHRRPGSTSPGLHQHQVTAARARLPRTSSVSRLRRIVHATGARPAATRGPGTRGWHAAFWRARMLQIAAAQQEEDEHRDRVEVHFACPRRASHRCLRRKPMPMPSATGTSIPSRRSFDVAPRASEERRGRSRPTTGTVRTKLGEVHERAGCRRSCCRPRAR